MSAGIVSKKGSPSVRANLSTAASPPSGPSIASSSINSAASEGACEKSRTATATVLDQRPALEPSIPKGPVDLVVEEPLD